MISEARRAYIREYQRNWVAARRQSWLNANGPCVLCGSSEQLEVDHVDASTKEIHVTSLWSMSDSNPRKVAELEKCRVLCRSCHAYKTTACQEKARGEDSGSSKLTEDSVRLIRTKFSLGSHTKYSLARDYGVDEKAIRSILKGETWSHVK